MCIRDRIFSFVAEHSQVRGFGRIGAGLRGFFSRSRGLQPGSVLCAQPPGNGNSRITKRKSASIRPDPRTAVRSATKKESARIRKIRAIRGSGRCGAGWSRTGQNRAEALCYERRIRANPPRPAPIRVPESVPPRRKKIRAHPQLSLIHISEPTRPY